MSPSPPSGGQPIRCSFCLREPLLATYGIDRERKPFVHVKVYKQKRIFANIVVTSGPVFIQCRECNRWLRINFVREVDMRQVEPQGVPGSHGATPARMIDAPRSAS